MMNVVELHPQTAYEDILFYLEGLESENTYNRYRKAIERFIKKQYNIPLQHVREDHFNNLSYTDMYKYRNYLRCKGYASSTVNNEMTAIFNLFKELNKIQREDGSHPYNLNVDQLRTKSLRVRETNSSGDLTWEEVDEWIEFVKNSNENNKEGKWIFLHMARLTGLRKEALAALTFKDLRKSGDVWQIHSTIKGKTTKVSIKEEDAQLLFSLQKGESKDQKIFGMSSKTMERLLDKIKEEFEIPKERNITIHSLRGLATYEAYLASGKDILAAQRFANHSSIETTYSYIRNREEANKHPSLYMGSKFEEDDVKNLSQEQWLEIYRELSRSSKYEIQRIMDRLGCSQ